MTAQGGCVRETEIVAALDGRLDPEATESALRHASTCASCRAARQAHASLRSLARGLRRHTPDPLAARRVRANVVRAALADEPAPRRQTLAAVAAVMLAVLTATVGWQFVHGQPVGGTTVGGVALAGAGVMSPLPGAVVAVRRAGPDTRIELTSGEVGFAVEHRHVGERFVVATADAEVEVRGTRFKLVAQRGLLRRVEVTEGVVVVRRPPEPERRVAAGTALDLPSPAAMMAEPVRPPSPPMAPEPAPSSLPVGPTHARLAPHAADVVLSQSFREGALAYVRGDSVLAASALRRFIDAAPLSDPRREDARYVLVLSLVHAGRDADAESAAQAYLREFPHGLRRPEVAMQLALSASHRSDCDRASGAALALPEDTDAHTRAVIAQALAVCHRP